MDGVYKQRGRFNENGNKTDIYTYIQKETIEIFGHIMRKEGIVKATGTEENHEIPS